jgi:hypothetical protein
LSVSRPLVLLGIVFLVVGGLVYLAARFNLPLGHLPGDFRIRNGNFTLYIPCATSILLSILLTVVLTLVVRFLHK